MHAGIMTVMGGWTWWSGYSQLEEAPLGRVTGAVSAMVEDSHRDLHHLGVVEAVAIQAILAETVPMVAAHHHGHVFPEIAEAVEQVAHARIQVLGAADLGAPPVLIELPLVALLEAPRAVMPAG